MTSFRAVRLALDWRDKTYHLPANILRIHIYNNHSDVREVKELPVPESIILMFTLISLALSISSTPTPPLFGIEMRTCFFSFLPAFYRRGFHFHPLLSKVFVIIHHKTTEIFNTSQFSLIRNFTTPKNSWLLHIYIPDARGGHDESWPAAGGKRELQATMLLVHDQLTHSRCIL